MVISNSHVGATAPDYDSWRLNILDSRDSDQNYPNQGYFRNFDRKKKGSRGQFHWTKQLRSPTNTLIRLQNGVVIIPNVSKRRSFVSSPSKKYLLFAKKPHFSVHCPQILIRRRPKTLSLPNSDRFHQSASVAGESIRRRTDCFPRAAAIY